MGLVERWVYFTDWKEKNIVAIWIRQNKYFIHLNGWFITYLHETYFILFKINEWIKDNK